jgi:hypothetical protein
MKTAAKLALLLCMSGLLTFAESWMGKIVDYACYEKSQSAPATPAQNVCAPTASTTEYGLRLNNGTVYKIDASANSKVAAAMRADTSKNKDGSFNVTGNLEGQSVKLDTITVQ